MKQLTKFTRALLLATGASALVALPAGRAAAEDAAAADPQPRIVREAAAKTRAKDQVVRFDSATRAEIALGRPSPRGRTARPGRAARDLREQDERRPVAGKVFGADDRYAIDDPTIYPWSAVCKVFAEFPDGTEVEGSAILVGDRFALTAGHVIYDADFGGFADRVEVVPAYDFGSAPFGRFLAIDTTAFRGFTDYGDFDWDVALLTLDGTPGDDAGWFGMTAAPDSDIVGATLNTAGFPSDRSNGALMYGATGYGETVTSGQILFRGTLDAFRGQSGSGLWLRYAEGRYVTGIVSTETSTYNRAARITTEMFDALDAWMDAAALADLEIASIGDALPAEFEGARAATIDVGVRNAGSADATTDVAVYARDAFARYTYLGRRTVFVAAGATVTARIGIGVPATLAGSTYDIVVEVNGDDAVPESDVDDNLAFGERFVMLAAVEDIDAGLALSRSMDPGDVVRLRLDVPDALRVLKLQLGGAGDVTAIVRRPDGSAFTVYPGSRFAVERLPAGGDWTVELRRSFDGRRTRTIRFRSIARF